MSIPMQTSVAVSRPAAMATALPLLPSQTFAVVPVGDFRVTSDQALSEALRPVNAALRTSSTTAVKMLSGAAGIGVTLWAAGSGLYMGACALFQGSQPLALQAFAALAAGIGLAHASSWLDSWLERRSLTKNFTKAVEAVEKLEPAVEGTLRGDLERNVYALSRRFKFYRQHPLALRLSRLKGTLSVHSTRLPQELEEALTTLETKGVAITKDMPLPYYLPPFAVIGAAFWNACSPDAGPGALLGGFIGGMIGAMLVHRRIERFDAARAYKRFDTELAPAIDAVERLTPTLDDARRADAASRLQKVLPSLGIRWRDDDYTMGRSIEEQPSLARLLTVCQSLHSRQKPKTSG